MVFWMSVLCNNHVAFCNKLLRSTGLQLAFQMFNNKKTIYKAHKRSLIFHKNVTAREKASKLFKMNIKSDEIFSVRWNDYLAALIVLANFKISKNKFLMKIIFKLQKVTVSYPLHSPDTATPHKSEKSHSTCPRIRIPIYQPAQSRVYSANTSAGCTASHRDC